MELTRGSLVRKQSLAVFQWSTSMRLQELSNSKVDLAAAFRCYNLDTASFKSGSGLPTSAPTVLSQQRLPPTMPERINYCATLPFPLPTRLLSLAKRTPSPLGTKPATLLSSSHSTVARDEALACIS